MKFVGCLLVCRLLKMHLRSQGNSYMKVLEAVAVHLGDYVEDCVYTALYSRRTQKYRDGRLALFLIGYMEECLFYRERAVSYF